MTLNEFRAWLDGYAASIDGAPTAEQWEAIKAKLVAVEEGAPMSAPWPGEGTKRRPDDCIISRPHAPTWPYDITCETFVYTPPDGYQVTSVLA
jgi:hypothetical protein